jgi:hypothetical protein
VKSILNTLVFTSHINITKETFVSAQDLATVEVATGIMSDTNYMVGIRRLVKELVLPEFKEAYLAFMNREWLLEKFGEGHTSLFFEYQRLVDGEPKWRLISLVLYRDKKTGHIMGTKYVYNIDSQKRIELELKASVAASKN